MERRKSECAEHHSCSLYFGTSWWAAVCLSDLWYAVGMMQGIQNGFALVLLHRQGSKHDLHSIQLYGDNLPLTITACEQQ